MDGVRFLLCGDCALTVEFGNEISSEVNGRVKGLFDSLREKPIRGVTECVPTFRSLAVYYDPCAVSYEKLERAIKKRIGSMNRAASGGGRVIKIPVCYCEEFGEDLNDVAAHAGMSVDEVIRLHSGTDYLIYMLGFLPGFAYLGGLDKRLVTPRLETPRTVIPQGSVGIGGEQTGIYPIASPGGWRLIGRTPVKPYDAQRERPILYNAGDYIRFVPVDRAEFARIEASAENGEYECEWDVLRGDGL